jgi:hypothetical protein
MSWRNGSLEEEEILWNYLWESSWKRKLIRFQRNIPWKIGNSSSVVKALKRRMHFPKMNVRA